MLKRLSDDTFESFLSSLCLKADIDLREVEFIDPYGMAGLLEMGRMARHEGDEKALRLPESEQVMTYLERMDFFRYAKRYFRLDKELTCCEKMCQRNISSDVLLELTPIEQTEDIHFIVGRVRERADMILDRHLNYDRHAIDGFIVALSEVCQNIIEHSENTGMVGIQKYHFKKLGKNVVKIAVLDLGIGFRESLKGRGGVKSEEDAIEKALFHSISRHEDAGRGHGLAAVRRFVDRWNGKLSLRSGSTKLSIIPEWSWGKEREKGLRFFPGAQISIMLPEMA